MNLIISILAIIAILICCVVLLSIFNRSEMSKTSSSSSPIILTSEKKRRKDGSWEIVARSPESSAEIQLGTARPSIEQKENNISLNFRFDDAQFVPKGGFSYGYPIETEQERKTAQLLSILSATDNINMKSKICDILLESGTITKEQYEDLLVPDMPPVHKEEKDERPEENDGSGDEGEGELPEHGDFEGAGDDPEDGVQQPPKKDNKDSRKKSSDRAHIVSDSGKEVQKD